MTRTNPTRSAPAIDPVVVRRSRDLLDRAEILFDNADGIAESAERFRQYYLTALRAAGAVLEIYEPSNRPVRRRRPASAWKRLPVVVGELAAYADYFADLSHLRLDIESGLIRTVDEQTVRHTRQRVIELLDAVEREVIAYEQGRLPHQNVRPDRTA